MKKYLFQHRKKLAIYLFICMVAAATQVGLAFVYKAISESALGGNLQEFIKVCLFVILYLLFDAFMDYLPRFTKAQLVQSVTMNLRNRLVDKVENTSIKDMNQTENTFFVAKLVNEMKVVEEEYLEPLASLVLSIFIFIFSLISALTLQSSFTFIMVVLSIFPLVAPYVAKKILSGKKNIMLDKQKQFLEKYEELVHKFTTLRMFNSFPFINRRLFSLSDRLRVSKVEHASAQGKTYAVSYGLGNIVFTGTWIVGGIFVITNSLTFPELIAMTQLMSMIAGPIQYFTDSFTELVSSKKIADDLIDYIERGSDINISSIENHKEQVLNEIQYLEMENVSFIDGDKEIIKCFNCKFEYGKKYAIVGESGSGKSTILKLLVGIYAPSEGAVKLNGINVNHIDKDYFYNKLGYIHQQTDIFNGTMAENVAVFHDAESDDIVQSLKDASLEKWLLKNDYRINENISEGQAKVSGGEKRRLDIARSLLKDSAIFIFDEPTTGLDKENERIIQDMIRNLKHKLVIIVTHSKDQAFLNSFDEVIELTS